MEKTGFKRSTYSVTMAEREMMKKYAKGEFTVIWKPKLCIHSGICVQTLPNVYYPKEKPWIKPENASIEELRSQISKCPSGALSHAIENSGQNEKSELMEAKIEVTQNGPLLVHGNIEVVDHSGNSKKKRRVTAFCRCGASANKPYCDGTHNEIEFKG